MTDNAATSGGQNADDAGQGYCLPSLGEPCGNCHRCTTPERDLPKSGPSRGSALRCRCVWRGERCENQATQEDGLCNWCGNDRTEHQLRKDPAAHVGPDGQYFGLSGRGQTHDYDANKPASTAACWYPDSDRVVLDAAL